MTDSKALKDRVEKKGTAVAKQEPRNDLLGLIDRMTPEIARALPRHMSPERLARIATTVARQTPLLLRCTPESFLGALMTCAQLGLEPGPLGHVYLIPFRNNKKGTYETQLIVGYKGLIDMARRPGHIESLVAREVYAADDFSFAYGLDDTLVHVPNLFAEQRGDVICYYAVAKYVGGGYTFIVMAKHDIEKIRSRAQAKDAGPWKTDYDEMAKKTVIRRLSKFLPMSAEMANAVALDESVRNVGSADDVELPLVNVAQDADPDPDAEAAAQAAAEADAPKGDDNTEQGQLPVDGGDGAK